MKEWNTVDENEGDSLWPMRELIRIISLLKYYNFEYQGIVPFGCGARCAANDCKHYRRSLAKGENLKVVGRCLNQMGYANEFGNKFEKDISYTDEKGDYINDHNICVTLKYSLHSVEAIIEYNGSYIPTSCENDENLN